MKNTTLTVQDALHKLMEGNYRFHSGLRSVDTFHSATKMKELAEKGQSPFGIILSCSDSRAPAEMIFDQGLGDLFVIRVAGNVVAPSQIASIEFAALNFKSPICVVMGHSQCGAVKTALSIEKNDPIELTPFLNKLVSKVRPAARAALQDPALKDSRSVLDAATWENVRRTVRLIRRKSASLAGLEREGALLVVGAVYDLHTGRVDFDLKDLGDGATRDSFFARSPMLAAMGAK